MTLPNGISTSKTTARERNVKRARFATRLEDQARGRRDQAEIQAAQADAERRLYAPDGLLMPEPA
jgi:hypothetical protein